MTPEIPLVQPEKYPYTCRLCGHIFKAPPMAGPQDPRLKKIGETIFNHMMRTDTNHQVYAVIALVMGCFLVEDPAALIFGAGVRSQVFQALRRHYLPDEKLHDVISRITPEQFELVMADMRDFLTEQGKYQFDPEKVNGQARV